MKLLLAIMSLAIWTPCVNAEIYGTKNIVEYCHRWPDTGKEHCHAQKPTDQPSKPCCKVCKPGGKACGDVCISKIRPCDSDFGCACNLEDLPFKTVDKRQPSANKCCVTCWRKKACGDGCIARDQKCDKPKGCACDLQI